MAAQRFSIHHDPNTDYQGMNHSPTLQSRIVPAFHIDFPHLNPAHQQHQQQDSAWPGRYMEIGYFSLSERQL